MPAAPKQHFRITKERLAAARQQLVETMRHQTVIETFCGTKFVSSICRCVWRRALQIDRTDAAYLSVVQAPTLTGKAISPPSSALPRNESPSPPKISLTGSRSDKTARPARRIERRRITVSFGVGCEQDRGMRSPGRPMLEQGQLPRCGNLDCYSS